MVALIWESDHQSYHKKPLLAANIKTKMKKKDLDLNYLLTTIQVISFLTDFLLFFGKESVVCRSNAAMLHPMPKAASVLGPVKTGPSLGVSQNFYLRLF